MTLNEQIKQIELLANQEPSKDLHKSEYWLIRGEVLAAQKAMSVIKKQQEIIEVLEDALYGWDNFYIGYPSSRLGGELEPETLENYKEYVKMNLAKTQETLDKVKQLTGE